MVGGLADSRPGPGCMRVSRCSWQAAGLTGGLPTQIRWASEGTLGAMANTQGQILCSPVMGKGAWPKTASTHSGLRLRIVCVNTQLLTNPGLNLTL